MLPLLGNMLNVSHAVIGRVVAITYAAFGLAITYGRRIMAPVQGAIIALFARELSPPCIFRKSVRLSQPKTLYRCL
jgi:hypothetical protein